MNVTRAMDGRANLHIWRTGEGYFKQKSPALLKEWTNLKFSLLPYPKGWPISHYDIRRPLPFPDDTFDAVYALHIIEHLTPEEASRFVAEIFRVLRAGGIFRVSTPDLESAVRAYLERLDECSSQPTKLEIVKYEWAVLELLDQMVREQSGGLMLETAGRGHFDSNYAHERYGDVFDEFHQPPSPERPEPDKTLRERITPKSLTDLPRALHRKVNASIFSWLQRRKAHKLNGDPRKMKESNLWTYDRLSLRLLLEKQGFKQFSVKSYTESDIVGWERYDLDRSNHGDHAIEPSLYVEARAQKQTTSQSNGAR
jgi:predicted SAM-dependent methyltransferase